MHLVLILITSNCLMQCIAQRLTKVIHVHVVCVLYYSTCTSKRRANGEKKIGKRSPFSKKNKVVIIKRYVKRMPSDNEYLWIFISIYTKIFLSMINMLFQSIK